MNANKMLVMGGLGPKWGEWWVIQRFVEKLLSVSMLCGFFGKGLGANNKLKSISMNFLTISSVPTGLLGLTPYCEK